MPRPDLTPGASATATTIVGPTDLASHLGLDAGDTFPEVYATSRMISLMELAAARVLRPLLGPGELSVGVGIDVTHSAPTLPGATVRATATFVRLDGKLYCFDVVAADDRGEIGRGTHRRAIVSTERLLAGAHRRLCGSNSMSPGWVGTGGLGCRRFPQRGGWWRGGAGMREDHEPAPQAPVHAHPRMSGITLEPHRASRTTDRHSDPLRTTLTAFGPGA